MAAPAATQRLPPTPRLLVLAAVGGIIVNLQRSLPFQHGIGTLFVDPYWVRYYLNNYADGYRRRALMGSLFRLVFRHQLSIFFINAFAFLALAGVFFLLFRTLIRFTQSRDEHAALSTSTVLLFALAGSVLTASCLETVGDMLHVAVLTFCAINLVAVGRGARERTRWVLAALAAALGFLMHEAALFFLVPALPFFLQRRPRLRHFVLAALLYVALAALAQHWSHEVLHPTYSAKLFRHGYQPATWDLPPFSAQFAWEKDLYFGNIARRIWFAERCLSAVALYIALSGAAAFLFSPVRWRRTSWAFTMILLASIPLWITAVDWGRFLVLAFTLAVISNAATPDESDSPALGIPAGFRHLTAALEWLVRDRIAALAVVFCLLAGPQDPSTHIGVLPFAATEVFVALLLLALLGRAFGWNPPDFATESALAAESEPR